MNFLKTWKVVVVVVVIVVVVVVVRPNQYVCPEQLRKCQKIVV